MAEPTPARRVALRWSEAVPDDRVVDAAADVHQGLAGDRLQLGDRVEPLAGVPMVVADTDPRGEAVQVDGDTVVELERPPEAAAGGAEVLLLVDASYSMRDDGGGTPRWGRARNAAVAFLASGRPLFTRAGLAAFTHETRVLAELGDPADADPDDLDEVQPRGQSDPAAALDRALRALHYEGDAGNQRAVVLVTDGEAPGEGAPGVARRAGNLGIAVHVARLDPHAGSDPLEEATALAEGTYQAGTPPDPLKPALEAVARAVGGSVDWRSPETAADETEFEVVLRTVTDEEDFP
jgi:hypothetical protein